MARHRAVVIGAQVVMLLVLYFEIPEPDAESYSVAWKLEEVRERALAEMVAGLESLGLIREPVPPSRPVQTLVPIEVPFRRLVLVLFAVLEPGWVKIKQVRVI